MHVFPPKDERKVFITLWYMVVSFHVCFCLCFLSALPPLACPGANCFFNFNLRSMYVLGMSNCQTSICSEFGEVALRLALSAHFKLLGVKSTITFRGHSWWKIVENENDVYFWCTRIVNSSGIFQTKTPIQIDRPRLHLSAQLVFNSLVHWI